MKFWIVLLFFAFNGLAVDNFLAHQEFMSLKNAAQRYGRKEFSSELFKKGEASDRAAMVVSLIQSKTFIGKTSQEVKQALGESNGHFWSGSIPAYFIEEGWSDKKDSWQVVFLLGKDQKVSEMKIHKNCCSKSIPSNIK